MLRCHSEERSDEESLFPGPAMKTYCVYIMASESGVLYIGVTNNLELRAFQHQSKAVLGFTARYNVDKLVYYELYGDIRVAIAREKQIKGWLRKRKIALIESMNPLWKDLIIELEKARSASVQRPSR
jgi:putative endonuclease